VPILVTELWISMEVKVEHELNAKLLILVTLYVRPVIGSVIVLGIVIAPVALGFEVTVAVTKSSVVYLILFIVMGANKKA
jgi:hypothetical protein